MKKYNKYGQAAIRTLEIHQTKNPLRDSWNTAIIDFYDSESSQNKGCPRSTFLGLCEVGLIKDISKGEYNSNSTINKKHAIDAVNYLKENRVTSISTKELWSKLNVGNKSHNSQMDVVLALWYKDLIV